MKTNVGTIDRSLRFALGLALFWLAFLSGLPVVEEPLVKYGAAAVGLVMIIVASVRICPIYSLLGLRTCREC
ncbi:MAG TPA: DUF2892 domain-containing protein [Rhodospirillaceae bacterium]|jgi:threonine/homoserine/homoserine lactone efflux protein|nr:hypothetical protein [Alphaproteobacteria bacterium]OUT39959.1 MAG: hypothetical protein CBB62_11610 [Micavibrio sp. TMED2]HCI47397.1 DUF2892 domain-containing protein [Rhodospirillaceae bacterium]MAS48140.1 hypothetical protein [Alphaproteobacteria bacterium]MAX96830.1 hypothetical protein [Alphaproteobacteria bacterium]|tara:strand:- start:3438 stop:3653 length:216 start_codon:yes stop_codon:yes gene_type:complete